MHDGTAEPRQVTPPKAVVYLLNYFITADIDVGRDIKDGKYETGKLPNPTCGNNAQRDIVVAVTAEQASNHQFIVQTSAGQKRFYCDSREYDKRYEFSVPKAYVHRKKGKMSEEERKTKAKRKFDQLKYDTETLLEYLDAQLRTYHRIADLKERMKTSAALTSLVNPRLNGIVKADSRGLYWEDSVRLLVKGVADWYKRNPSQQDQQMDEEDRRGEVRVRLSFLRANPSRKA